MVRRIIACLVFGVVFSGCATTPFEKSDSPAIPAPESVELIARNFVSVLAQVPSLPPTGTTLSVPLSADDSSGFGNSLRSALLQTGYVMRTGNGADVDGTLTYSVEIESATDSDKAEYTGDGAFRDVAIHQVAVGDIGLRRRFVVLNGGRLMPLSPMQSRGFDSANLVTDDSSFERQGTPGYADVRSTSDTPEALPEDGDDFAQTTVLDSSAISDNTVNADSVDSSLVPPPIASEPRAEPEPLSPSDTPLALQSNRERVAVTGDLVLPLQDTHNYRDLGESNYAELFYNLRLIDERIIEFGNDSTELNAQGAQILDAMLGEYDEDRDRISVIGSSHGAGAYPGAQKDLAQGRALQVQDKLTSLGVSPQNLFVEASWSTQYYDEMLPRRGVVVSVWRDSQ